MKTLTKICLNCKKEFGKSKKNSYERWEKVKYCSRKCVRREGSIRGSTEMKLCDCGCGTQMKKYSFGRVQKFIKGHRIVSDETRRRISESGMGTPAWNKGKHYHLTPEHSENIRKSLIGNKYNTGKKWSDKKREAIMAGRENMVSWNKGTVGLSKPNSGSFKVGAMAGDKNVNWKGGITKEMYRLRGLSNMKEWQRQVKKRDGFKCQKCDEQRHKKVTAHHILNFSNHSDLRSKLDNGITLCYPCHKKFHAIYGVRNNTREQIEEFTEKKYVWTEYLPNYEFETAA